MFKLKYTIVFVIAVVFFMGEISAFAQEYKVVRGVIDVHSKISDGLYYQERVAESAREKGFKVVIFCESALRRWEYGLWPLRNIVKRTYQENSVLRLGLGKYMERFAALKKKFSDLVLIPGMEASPYFYWEGSPLSRKCSLVDYYKQFLIIGLNKDYQNLPVVGNRRFSYLSKNALFSLWPILLIILGLRLLKKKALGVSFILVGILFLANNLPFPTSRFNVYQGRQGIRPYQDLIDYVNRMGGIIFLAHPEVFSQKAYFGIESYTTPYPEDLILARDYTGFSLSLTLRDRCEALGFRCGMTEPGDMWDNLLMEYMEGKRKKPSWIIGSPHYTGESGVIDLVETIFFVKEAKEEEVLDALKQGRMYVRFNSGSNPLTLNEFSVKNNGFGSIRIIIKGSQVPALEPVEATKIELIRNGKIFKSFEETQGNWTITVEDNLSSAESKAYYRLKISSHSSLIFTNPLFVEVKK